MNISKILSFFICLSLLMFASCITDGGSAKPYYISSVEVTTGPVDDICNFACGSFDFFNNSGKEIECVKFSARVYDSEGEGVGLGSNGIKFSYSEHVSPYEKVLITFSLDKIIGPEVDDSYSLDFIFASEIQYADGTVWSDPLGLFCM